MSKSMWIDAVDCKPVASETDKWKRENGISDKVVVWLEEEEEPDFGTYSHASGNWAVSGRLGFKQARVKYFAYIDNPYK